MLIDKYKNGQYVKPDKNMRKGSNKTYHKLVGIAGWN